MSITNALWLYYYISRSHHIVVMLWFTFTAPQSLLVVIKVGKADTLMCRHDTCTLSECYDWTFLT